MVGKLARQFRSLTITLPVVVAAGLVPAAAFDQEAGRKILRWVEERGPTLSGRPQPGAETRTRDNLPQAGYRCFGEGGAVEVSPMKTRVLLVRAAFDLPPIRVTKGWAEVPKPIPPSLHPLYFPNRRAAAGWCRSRTVSGRWMR